MSEPILQAVITHGSQRGESGHLNFSEAAFSIVTVGLLW